MSGLVYLLKLASVGWLDHVKFKEFILLEHLCLPAKVVEVEDLLREQKVWRNVS